MMKELILFYANWCTPCKKVKDYIGDFSSDYTITKVNIDEQPDLIDTLDVKALPTVILMDNGTEADRVVGDVSKDQLVEKLNL